jgi:hypothetical protein
MAAAGEEHVIVRRTMGTPGHRGARVVHAYGEARADPQRVG